MIGLVCRMLVYRTGSVRKSDKVLKQVKVKYLIYGFVFDSYTDHKNLKLSFQYKRQGYIKL